MLCARFYIDHECEKEGAIEWCCAKCTAYWMVFGVVIHSGYDDDDKMYLLWESIQSKTKNKSSVNYYSETERERERRPIAQIPKKKHQSPPLSPPQQHPKIVWQKHKQTNKLWVHASNGCDYLFARSISVFCFKFCGSRCHSYNPIITVIADAVLCVSKCFSFRSEWKVFYAFIQPSLVLICAVIECKIYRKTKAEEKKQNKLNNNKHIYWSDDDDDLERVWRVLQRNSPNTYSKCTNQFVCVCVYAFDIPTRR